MCSPNAPRQAAPARNSQRARKFQIAHASHSPCGLASVLAAKAAAPASVATATAAARARSRAGRGTGGVCCPRRAVRAECHQSAPAPRISAQSSVSTPAYAPLQATRARKNVTEPAPIPRPTARAATSAIGAGAWRRSQGVAPSSRPTAVTGNNAASNARGLTALASRGARAAAGRCRSHAVQRLAARGCGRSPTSATTEPDRGRRDADGRRVAGGTVCDAAGSAGARAARAAPARRVAWRSDASRARDTARRAAGASPGQERARPGRCELAGAAPTNPSGRDGERRGDGTLTGSPVGRRSSTVGARRPGAIRTRACPCAARFLRRHRTRSALRRPAPT